MVDKNLPEEIGQFYDALLEKVTSIRSQAQERLVEVRKEQSELAANLKEKLAKGESLRKADFERMLASLIEERKKRQEEVMSLLERFQKEEEGMAQGLKNLLTDDKGVRTKELKKFLTEFKRKGEERKQDVGEIVEAAKQVKREAVEMIEKFEKEREEMVKQWQKLAASMRQKRLARRIKNE